MCKKIIKFFSLIMLIGTCFTLTSCQKYKDVEGVYECYEVKIDGRDYFSQYEYYRIILEANGDCIVESKAVGGIKYDAIGTFDIEGTEINIYTKVNSATITETYEIIDDEIIMDTQLQGVHVYAKFKKQ